MIKMSQNTGFGVLDVLVHDGTAKNTYCELEGHEL